MRTDAPCTGCEPFDPRKHLATPSITMRDHRAALVRVVVAQQWAVAVLLSSEGRDAEPDDYSFGWDSAADAVTTLPCADDVVAELLGER